MSAFGFDPEQIFARRRSRPRIVRPPGQLRRRIIIFGVIAAIIVLLIVARWLLGLRADYLYYKSVGHTNVFWTPLIAHIVLFFIGFAIVAVIFAAAVWGCAASAANLDKRGRRIVLWSGAVIALLAGIAGGRRSPASGRTSSYGCTRCPSGPPTPSSTSTTPSSSSPCRPSTTSWACSGVG